MQSKRNVVLPKSLQNIISEDMDWFAKTNMVVNRVENYLHDADLYFFPEYTNHRLLHIENILRIVSKLVHSDTLSKLAPKDISFMILSVYLHDIGMFLKPDGLKVLLTKEEWQFRFNKFIKIASRMSDVELKKIYGDTHLFIKPTNLNNCLSLTERDKLTYGEFLRRYHAAIAEFVAINGFPGYETKDLLLEFDDEQRKIIGLLAKSHGMSIRSAAEESNIKLMGKRNTYKPSNTPIVYLIALLRIGDILDMGKDRAPHILSGMQHFNSSLSKEEWEWNQTIDSSNYNWDTAKTLYIQSEPQSTSQFVKVESNLKWFQSELDFTWAALCDYYGNEYNLTIHRIVSNIFEQPELFEKKFLIKEAKIKVTSNLSKLLVDPLYHSDPLFAVRELLQNSMDACNLRKKLERLNGNNDYSGWIDVLIDTKKMTFTIKDNGIGMNADVIVNYYLTIGASFRNSDYWKKTSINDDESDSIVRSGRFGVGFLATFLLGEKVNVITHHVDDKLGYSFSVTLEDENVSAARIEGVEIGTVIIVDMKKDITKFWDKGNSKQGSSLYNNQERIIYWNEWYHCIDPKVNYYIDGRKVEQEINFQTPSGSKMIENWYNLKSDKFDNVNYGFHYQSNKKSFTLTNALLGEGNLLSNVILNGFLVSNKINFKHVWGIPNNTAVCSITDDKNLLQLNLSRTDMNYDNEIFKEINIELWKWQLASLLCCDVKSVRRLIKKRRKTNRQKLSEFLINEVYISGIFYTHDSFSFLHPCYINKLNLYHIYMLKETDVSRNKEVFVQSHISNSSLPILIHSDSNFKKQYGLQSLDSQSDHLFELIDFSNYKYPLDNTYTELINDLFSDVPDLWIPFDFNARKEKFKKAFEVLSKYSVNGELRLK